MFRSSHKDLPSQAQGQEQGLVRAVPALVKFRGCYKKWGPRHGGFDVGDLLAVGEVGDQALGFRVWDVGWHSILHPSGTI